MTDTAAYALEYEGVVKAFGSHQVLRGLDLRVPRGTLTAVIGRSGTGKSVTFKHALGLLKPDAGVVRVMGQDLAELDRGQLRRLRLRFGMVFQNAALFDSLDVFENVAFPLREHRRLKPAELEAEVMRVLGQVGLTAAVDKLPSELSGGMRKRVGLARALVHKPEILLYDEPTTGLDPIMCAQIDRLIRQTQELTPGITSVMISHDIKSALELADHVAMLHEGRIIAQGPPSLFREHDDPRVRQFVEGRLDGPIQVD